MQSYLPSFMQVGQEQMSKICEMKDSGKYECCVSCQSQKCEGNLENMTPELTPQLFNSSLTSMSLPQEFDCWSATRHCSLHFKELPLAILHDFLVDPRDTAPHAMTYFESLEFGVVAMLEFLGALSDIMVLGNKYKRSYVRCYDAMEHPHGGSLLLPLQDLARRLYAYCPCCGKLNVDLSTGQHTASAGPCHWPHCDGSKDWHLTPDHMAMLEKYFKDNESGTTEKQFATFGCHDVISGVIRKGDVQLQISETMCCSQACYARIRRNLERCRAAQMEDDPHTKQAVNDAQNATTPREKVEPLDERPNPKVEPLVGASKVVSHAILLPVLLGGDEQSSFTCDPATRCISFGGTATGWSTGGIPGMIQRSGILYYEFTIVKLGTKVPSFLHFISPFLSLAFLPSFLLFPAFLHSFLHLSFFLPPFIFLPSLTPLRFLCFPSFPSFPFLPFLSFKDDESPSIQVGFAVEGFHPNESESNGVGDCANSWGVDGCRRAKWTAAFERGVASWPCTWKVGDVVGLSANIDAGMIAVSKNGDWVEDGGGVVFEDVAIRAGVFPCFSAAKSEFRYAITDFQYGASADDFWKRLSITTITIPPGTTSIPCKAYAYHASIVSVEFPDSVISIGAMAFAGCTSLSSVVIPKCVVEIGFDAFKGCQLDPACQELYEKSQANRALF
jgi:hypothetical protein